MKAISIARFGKNDVLEYGDFPKPQAQAHEVLVRARAAGVNPRDWMIRGGRYVFKRALPKFPFVLGSDCAGEVESVGKGASKFKIGDRVYGMQVGAGRMGAYSQFVAVPESAIATIPDELSFEAAAGIPCAGLTAWQSLHQLSQVRAGMKVAVIGAAGGVGSYGVQIAAAAGAEVTGVCSESSAAMVRELGAAHCIDYKTMDYREVLENQDIVFNAFGKDSFEQCRQIMGKRSVYITTVPGPKKWLRFVLNNLVSSQRAKVVVVRARGRDLKSINQLVRAGKLKTIIDSEFRLENTADALTKSRTFHSHGKIILNIP